MAETTAQQKINKQLFEKLEFAYFCVDHSMMVKNVSGNLTNYGFDEIQPGTNIQDYVDFMVGLDSRTELDLPMVSSPSGIPISVSLLPSREQLTVLIANASGAAEQRRQLQQKANENELLVYQQRKLMAQLEEASKELAHKNALLEEASRLQTSFLSGVSHEFRTPLTSIIGYTDLVKQNLNQLGKELQNDGQFIAQESGDYVRSVQRSSKHLLSLVENLLDHGKLDSQEIVIRPKPTSVTEILEDVELLLRPLSTTKGIDFSVDADVGHNSSGFLDDSRLRQCLINLVGNAIKFTDVGSVQLRASWKNEQLSISVTDTGPGISAEEMESIRLPFWQGADTGKAGTGLGLTITERLIELMGGELEIESEVGKGTKVHFSIPAAHVDDTELVSAENEADVALNILLAEDDSDIAELVVMMLVERGMRVTRVENGALAVAALNEDDFDIVLMDIHMPVMTGYEAIEKLKAQGNDTPIIIMSASAIEADRERAQRLGCSAYLVKPVDIDDIIGIAGQVLAR